jgi:phage terminase large subunit-like protein
MVKPVSFEDASNPRDVVSETFLLGGEFPGEVAALALEQREVGTKPLYVSSYDGSEKFAEEFMVGARLLGFEPTPQQWKIASALNAWDLDRDRPLQRTLGVCVPRRAGKTTALLAIALGRCMVRPGYTVLFTAQSGTKASARFLEMARNLERKEPDPERRGFRIMRGAGNQNLTFLNGSLFQVLPPKPDAFRGDSGDMILLDEAQEHTADVSAELLGAILPTMDTRPGAQLVVAGTAGERRSGIFWDTLQEGRKELPRTGIVEFAAPDNTTEEEASVPALWETVHPGIGTLTDLETIENNFQKLPRPNFLREYLGIWPEDYSQSAIDQEAWGACTTTFSKKPEQFALAFDVSVDGSVACIAAAWREGDQAYVEIVEHKLGTDWLVPRINELARKYRLPIAHDSVGSVLVEVAALQRLRPRPKLQPLGYRDLAPGCASIMKEINARTLRHFDQPSLNEAVSKVVKRPLGDNGWAWGRRASGGDITPLAAATFALRAYDNMKTPQKTLIVTSNSK